MKDNSIHIRKALFKDIDDLVKLLDELFAIEEDFEFDERKQRKGLRMLLESDNDCIMVAEHEGQVVGMCTIQTFISTAEGGDVGYVEDMIVRKDYARKGIGKKILSSIEEWGKGQGLKRIQLLADKGNSPALRFYKGSDWSTTNLICLKKPLR